MSNLEPIDESDLDLKGKFFGGGEAAKKDAGADDLFLGMKEIKTPEFPQPEKKQLEERALEKEKTYSKILSKIKSSQAQSDDLADAVTQDAKETAETITPEAKVDKLVKLAMVKGVVYAVKVAKHMDDNYTLDEFHDKLMANEFHDALVEKGLIQEL